MLTITEDQVFTGPIEISSTVNPQDYDVIQRYVHSCAADWLEDYRNSIQKIHTLNDRNAMMLFKHLCRDLEYYLMKICIRSHLLSGESLDDLREYYDEEGELFQFESQVETESNTQIVWPEELKERPDLHVAVYESLQSYMAKLYATARGNLVEMRKIVYKDLLV